MKTWALSISIYVLIIAKTTSFLDSAQPLTLQSKLSEEPSGTETDDKEKDFFNLKSEVDGSV